MISIDIYDTHVCDVLQLAVSDRVHDLKEDLKIATSTIDMDMQTITGLVTDINALDSLNDQIAFKVQMAESEVR